MEKKNEKIHYVWIIIGIVAVLLMWLISSLVF